MLRPQQSNTALSFFFHSFSLLSIIFVPITFRSLPFENRLGEIFFGSIIEGLNLVFFQEHILFPISSDSRGLYWLILILLFIALVCTLSLRHFKSSFIQSFIMISRRIMILYLSLVLFKYGCDKIFGTQFYTPEPNILFTRFGNLEKDILYWSLIGSTPTYSLFLGITEVIIATGILFRKTRVFFLFLSVLMLLYIVGINFIFDISVKIFSTLLLLTAITLLSTSLLKIIRFFSGANCTPLQPDNLIPRHFPTRLKLILTFLIGTMIFLECVTMQLYPSKIQQQNQRPLELHGAFNVLNKSQEITDGKNIEHVYFHSKNYLIFHFRNEEMLDFHYSKGGFSNEIILTDYDLNQHVLSVVKKDKITLLAMNGLFGYDTLQLTEIDLQSLPVFQDQFHWTVEAIH